MSETAARMRKVMVSAVGIGLIQLLAAIALAFVIYFALLSGEITAGGFVSYITAVTWMMNPAKRLSKINETIQTGLAAAHSSFALMDEPAEMDTGTVTLAQVRGRIEYRHVGFRYPVAESEALQDAFTIEPADGGARGAPAAVHHDGEPAATVLPATREIR
jgi:subfamily B ATP-binding cassette protein MsbA